MENKQLICDSLCVTLRLTRQFEGLVALEYFEEDEEVLPVFFIDGNSFCGKPISVECDSGIAMIRDILNNL